MADVYPADFTSPAGQVRLLIPDTAQDENDEYIFTDGQIAAFLSIYKDNIKRAAAQALDVLATDTALLLKVVRTDDLQVDGVKVAAELRARAKSLREDADADDYEDAAAEGFQVVYPTYVPSAWEAEGMPRWH